MQCFIKTNVYYTHIYVNNRPIPKKKLNVKLFKLTSFFYYIYVKIKLDKLSTNHTGYGIYNNFLNKDFSLAEIHFS